MRTVWWWVAVAALWGCIACGTSGTGEEVVPFTLAIETDPVGRRFTTATGWEVELEEAHIALGAVTLYSNAPPTASWMERLRGWFVPVAHAHAGFDEYEGGTVRGELLEPVVLDLLGEGRPFEAALEGIAGPVRSVSLELRTVAAAPLSGAHARVRGTASRDGEVIRFEGGLALPADAKSRRVTGIPAELTLADGAEVRLVVHPQRWFADADFSSLPEAGEGGVRPIPTDSQVHAAWYLGARGWGAFTVH